MDLPTFDLPEGYTAKVEPGDDDYPPSLTVMDADGNEFPDERASTIVLNEDGTVSWAGSPDYDYPNLREYILMHDFQEA